MTDRRNPAGSWERNTTDGLSPRQAAEENLFALLDADHHAIECTMQKFESNASREQQRHLIGRLISQVVLLSAAEEQYVCPAAREKLPDGNEIAEHKLAEHATDEELMKQLAGLTPENRQSFGISGQLTEHLRQHIAEDETNFFPRLRGACSPQELQDLGTKVEIAKGSASTRPRPAAPDSFPINLASDPTIGTVDRLHDWLSGRSHSTDEG